ncbi:11533_t:CDS:2, partial [Racocetra persica]
MVDLLGATDLDHSEGPIGCSMQLAMNKSSTFSLGIRSRRLSIAWIRSCRFFAGYIHADFLLGAWIRSCRLFAWIAWHVHADYVHADFHL